MPASGRAAGTVELAAISPLEDTLAEPGKPLVMGTDEYQRYFYEVFSDGWTVFFTPEGALSRQLPPTALAGVRVRSASRSLTGDFIALATDDGRVSMQQVRFTPRYENQKLVDLELAVRDRGLVAIDPAGRPLREAARTRAPASVAGGICRASAPSGVKNTVRPSENTS